MRSIVGLVGIGPGILEPLDAENATTSSWGPRTLAFTPETFLLSYSLPDFYFHSVQRTTSCAAQRAARRLPLPGTSRPDQSRSPPMQSPDARAE